MGFVYEKLTEQDKEFVASFKFPQPLASYSLAKVPRHWVADREREIFFVCLGGQGYKYDREFPPTYYRLIWKGQPIRIEAYRKGTGDNTEGIKAFWKIDCIIASKRLKIDGQLIVETVKEIIETYEYRDNANVLFIEFVEIAEPFFAKGDINNA